MLRALVLLSLCAAASAASLLALGDKRGNKVWDDFGSIARYEISVFEANIPSERWNSLGHHAQSDWDPLKTTIHSFRDETPNKTALAVPTNFTQIWNSDGDTIWQAGSLWRMECPDDFVSLGDFAYPSKDLKAPPKDMFTKFRCVSTALTEPCRGWGIKIWDNDNSIARKDASVWPTLAESSGFTEFFFSHTAHNDRPKITPMCLKKSSFNIV